MFGVDPMLDSFDAFELEPVELSAVSDQAFDGIVLVTPHEEFDEIDWSEIGREGGSVVIDGRDTLALAETEHREYTIGGSE